MNNQARLHVKLQYECFMGKKVETSPQAPLDYSILVAVPRQNRMNKTGAPTNILLRRAIFTESAKIMSKRLNKEGINIYVSDLSRRAKPTLVSKATPLYLMLHHEIQPSGTLSIQTQHTSNKRSLPHSNPPEQSHPFSPSLCNVGEQHGECGVQLPADDYSPSGSLRPSVRTSALNVADCAIEARLHNVCIRVGRYM